MKITTLLFFLGFFLLVQHLNAQATFPQQRFVNWQVNGSTPIDETNYQVIELTSLGIDATGQTDCSVLINQLITTYFSDSIVLLFPAGQFSFDQTIQLKSNLVLAGVSMDQTTFNFNLGGTGSSIEAIGQLNGPVFPISSSAVKGQTKLVCQNYNFAIGDWVRISCNDSLLVSSSWALGTVGQLVQISDIQVDTLFLTSALRRSYISEGVLSLQKIVPLSGIGIRCLTIRRLDDTAPYQQSNILFEGVVHSVVSRVAFYNCTFSHIDARTCSNLSIRSCYFQDAFGYGGGGRGYGVVLQATSNECLVEDNIFKHLRHSMLLQSGANGNVMAFNFSTDAFWEETSLPANSSGEIVLHGNYVYSNLFEQNVIGNIVIDNSHGANGPDNLFYRNRATLYGIFFSDQSSPNQLFIGNHVTNTSFPYSLVNYNIQGLGHYQFANNNKGTIVPNGTQLSSDTSFAYQMCPLFVPLSMWLTIGDQPAMLQYIPAQQRYLDQSHLISTCDASGAIMSTHIIQIALAPNPVQQKCIISIQGKPVNHLFLLDSYGRLLQTIAVYSNTLELDLSQLQSGIYFLQLENQAYLYKLMKE
ncbi:MAG: glycosyl hydrolase family 28-related protein [Flavobacteriales bacterium]